MTQEGRERQDKGTGTYSQSSYHCSDDFHTPSIPFSRLWHFSKLGTLVKGYLPQVDGKLPRAHIRTECACCFCQSDLPWQGHYALFTSSCLVSEKLE